MFLPYNGVKTFISKVCPLGIQLNLPTGITWADFIAFTVAVISTIQPQLPTTQSSSDTKLHNTS